MLGFPYRGSEVSQRALRRPRAVLRLASSFSSSPAHYKPTCMRLDAIGIPSDKLLTCSTRARPRNSKEHKGGSEALPCGLDSGSWSRLARLWLRVRTTYGKRP